MLEVSILFIFSTISKIDSKSEINLGLIFSSILIFDNDEPFDLEIGGFYKHKKGSEPHVTSPVTVLKLQKAVRSGDRAEWNKYLEALEERDNVQIRDLFTLPENNKISISSPKGITRLFIVANVSTLTFVAP